MINIEVINRLITPICSFHNIYICWNTILYPIHVYNYHLSTKNKTLTPSLQKKNWWMGCPFDSSSRCAGNLSGMISKTPRWSRHKVFLYAWAWNPSPCTQESSFCTELFYCPTSLSLRFAEHLLYAQAWAQYCGILPHAPLVRGVQRIGAERFRILPKAMCWDFQQACLRSETWLCRWGISTNLCGTLLLWELRKLNFVTSKQLFQCRSILPFVKLRCRMLIVAV